MKFPVLDIFSCAPKLLWHFYDFSMILALQGFNLGQKRSPPGEAHSNLDILHQEPDIFQKLLRPYHLFFLSSIFTSGTPYFFLFSSLLLISIGNENETEPVIGGGRGRKKNCGNSAFLLLDKDIIKPLSVIRWRLVCCIMPTF